MKFLKKYWYFIFILMITVGLGVMTFLTSQKLNTTQPVAPNVPQAKPAAAEPACTIQFTINPPPACGDTCGADTDCPTDHACSASKCVLKTCQTAGVNCDESKCRTIDNTPTPTNTPTNTPTPTPEPPKLSCSDSCTVNTDCKNGLICNEGMCRNPSCTDKTNCTCDVVVKASCNNACEVNSDCSGGLVCIDSMCRNSSCTEKTNCTCDVAAAPTPKIPVSGTGPSVLGATVIGGGFLLLLLGLAL